MTTVSPTHVPSAAPTIMPTSGPSISPSIAPTAAPTDGPTIWALFEVGDSSQEKQAPVEAAAVAGGLAGAALFAVVLAVIVVVVIIALLAAGGVGAFAYRRHLHAIEGGLSHDGDTVHEVRQAVAVGHRMSEVEIADMLSKNVARESANPVWGLEQELAIQRAENGGVELSEMKGVVDLPPPDLPPPQEAPPPLEEKESFAPPPMEL